MDGPLLLWLAGFTAALMIAVFVELGVGTRRLRHLHDVPPAGPGEMPSVSIVIAARNEARGIEPALRSVLSQQGGGLETIVVDDRSDDGTGAILDRMAAENAGLRVVHVAELPAGWLGKNHALWLGAQAARGELLLFTDADVVMTPDTVARAAGYLVREGMDHVTVAPRVIMPGSLLQAFGVAFGIFFSLFTRPWKARDPRSKQHVGIGAFNLVRAEPYRRMGTHRAIAMRPDDDVKLGKLVKKNGFRSDFVIGAEHVSVEWYHSLAEVIHGLRKNGFAGVDYRLSLVLFATVSMLLFFIGPFAAVFVTEGWTRVLYGVAVGLMLVMHAAAARAQRTPMWTALFFPLACVLFLVVVWNATIYALWNRGIEWRGTHYPLDELRANKV
jgi:glycosyltransferase involved in cell wall biosynthesis